MRGNDNGRKQAKKIFILFYTIDFCFIPVFFYSTFVQKLYICRMDLSILKRRWTDRYRLFHALSIFM